MPSGLNSTIRHRNDSLFGVRESKAVGVGNPVLVPAQRSAVSKTLKYALGAFSQCDRYALSRRETVVVSRYYAYETATSRPIEAVGRVSVNCERVATARDRLLRTCTDLNVDLDVFQIVRQNSGYQYRNRYALLLQVFDSVREADRCPTMAQAGQGFCRFFNSGLRGVAYPCAENDSSRNDKNENKCKQNMTADGYGLDGGDKLSELLNHYNS